MEVQDEVLDLLFDLTYKVTNYVRNNRHCKDGPRIKDVMLFKTIYKAENHQITMSEVANVLGVSPAAVSQMIAGFDMANVYSYLDYLGTSDCAHLRDILKKTAYYMEENKE